MAPQSVFPLTYRIDTPRLTLRTMDASDAAAFFELFTNPANYPHHDEPDPDTTLAEAHFCIGRFAQSTATGRDGFLIFTLRETGEVVGWGGYNCFESVEPGPFLGTINGVDDAAATPAPAGGRKGMTDLGIMLDHKHWRKGHGMEVLCALVEYAVSDLRCELFRAETEHDNEPWRGLMRAAGLGAYEGKQRASYDKDLEVWYWPWDVSRWEQAKKKLMAKGRWPL